LGLSNADVIKLRENDTGATWQDLAATVDMTGEALRKRYKRALKGMATGTVIPANASETKADPLSDHVAIFHDKKEKKEVDWKRLLDVAKSTQAIRGDLSDTQTAASVTIDTDEPIIITLQSDWHLGHAAVMYDEWAKDIDLILNTPNVFMMDLGDSYNNMRQFKTLAAVMSQVIAPDLQAVMFKGVVDELTSKNKLLAKVDGNHDAEFDERIFGEQLQNYLLAKMKAPRFPNRGLLTLNAGKSTWRFLLFHKSRFRSIINPTHGAIREYQLDYPADIVAGAHDHVPAASIIYSNMRAADIGAGFGGESFLIKLGTYQQDTSGFGYRYFHNGGIPVFFTVVLDPRTSKKYLFNSLDDAISWRKLLLSRRNE